MPLIWLSLGIGLVSCFLAGMMLTVSISLTLEQVPDWRGTMMSIHSASMSVGSMLAASLGGIILIAFNYSVLGIVMGIIGIVGCLSFYLFSVDPIKPQIH